MPTLEAIKVFLRSVWPVFLPPTVLVVVALLVSPWARQALHQALWELKDSYMKKGGGTTMVALGFLVGRLYPWVWRKWTNAEKRVKANKKDYTEVVQVSLSYYAEGHGLQIKTLRETSLDKLFYDSFIKEKFLGYWSNKVAKGQSKREVGSLIEFPSEGEVPLFVSSFSRLRVAEFGTKQALMSYLPLWICTPRCDTRASEASNLFLLICLGEVAGWTFEGKRVETSPQLSFRSELCWQQN
jgi:hypothetical protein